MRRDIELERKMPPKQADIEDTIEIFKGFCITPPDIPTFKTYAELEKWRRDYILKNTRW